jgi:hypothetical protein
MQSTNTFTVSWDGNDGSGSGIATYDVQYRAGSAAWINWLLGTTQETASFSGNASGTYSFRVRARDKAGNLGDFSSPETVTINAMSGALSISFSSAENSLSLDMNILATGAAGITLTSIREERTYTTWGTETEPPESINFTIPGGTTRTLTRTVGLDSIQRSKALGSGTEGGFTLTFNISGQDNLSNPVSCIASIPVTVSAGLPTTLNIGSISVQLPPSPYYVGDAVSNASIVINATGFGTVQGQVLVDGGTGWSPNPSFSATISGLTTINIQGNIPTTDPGQHTVRVEMTSPEILAAQAVYTVVDATASPFTAARIVLIPDVAELLDLDGTALATYNSAGGYEDFNFTGIARLNLISLENTEIPEVTLDHLVIRYYDSDPITAHIIGGTVEKEAQGSEPVLTLAGGALKVRRLFFQGNVNPETDHLLADAVLYWQEIAQELFLVEGLQIKTQGLEEGSFSINPGEQKEFEAFGKRFTVHDQGGNTALALDRDEANNRHSFTMAGQVSWPEKSGTVTNYQPLGNFSGFTLYSDGEVQVDLPVNNYAVIPDYLTLNRLHLVRVSNNLVLNLHGRIENLPFPLDTVAEDIVLAFDPLGNPVGNAPVIDEQGHALDSDNASQWEYAIATLDLTYLKADLFFGQGGVLFRDQSLIMLGVDVYLNLREAGGGMAAPEERRISFGEPDGGGNLIDGVEIDLSGQINWPASDIHFQDKKLDVSILTLRIENIGISQEPSFKFVAAGSIILDFPLVEGGADFQNLEIELDGNIAKSESAGDDIEGEFDIMSVVKLIVGDVDWGGEDILEFNTDNTTGSGENRNISSGTEKVDVTSWFRLEGAEIQIGDTGAAGESLIGGTFDSLTVFKPVNGNKSFVVKNIEASLYNIKLKDTDIEYLSTFLRVSGKVKIIPKDIEAVVVGKIGVENSKPTVGLFISAQNLKITVYPNVYLDEVGGGFFLNPSDDDLALVRSIAAFEKPELGLVDNIDELRPEGADDAGSFALILLGGVYIADKNLIKGRAMITVMSNRVELDAEVDALKKVLEGEAYLAISWDPAYAEGVVKIEFDLKKILSGSGELEFYIYSTEAWGIMGAYNIALFSQDLATGSLFVGPPGFMVDTKNSMSLDIGFVSGGFSLEGMFWYYRVPDPDTWGAYAKVEVWGEILWGLLSARAALEGALISAYPMFTVYAVGSLRVKVCYVVVFDGSLWVSVGTDGIDGGTGRNAYYDGLIDEARNMAAQMNQARGDLLDELDDAFFELVRLSDEQRQAAALALVERSGIIGGLIEIIFQYNELDNWGDNLPPALDLVYKELFGGDQNALVQARTELNNIQNQIDDNLDSLKTIQQSVAEDLEIYQALWQEELPDIQDLGMLGNPFQGMQTTVVNFGGVSKTVTVGFQINESQANSQVEKLSSIREDFAEYQEAFIEQAGIIDAKLQMIDEILFENEQNLSALNQAYGNLYARMGGYVDRFVGFQDENYENAVDSLARLQTAVINIPIIGSEPLEMALNYALQIKAGTLSSSNPTFLNSWNNERIGLINALVTTGGGPSYSVPQDIINQGPTEVFKETGLELWHRIPITGFEASRDQSPQRKNQALQTFKGSSGAFRGKWASATELTDTVFGRKSDLYDILYEIYDQLAAYGSGMIGVTGQGNAAGYPGLAGAGLACRTSVAAGTIQSIGVPLPAGAGQPQDPTVGPLNPLLPAQTAPPQQYQFEPMMKNDEPQKKSGQDSLAFYKTTPQLNGTGIRFGQPRYLKGMQILCLSTSFIPENGVKVAAATTPPDSQVPSEIEANDQASPAGEPVTWVPIQQYFREKRAEIGPFLEIPAVDSFEGRIESSSEFSAILAATFSASHPVGIVEYAYTISTAPQDQSASTQTGQQGGSPGFVFASLGQTGGPSWYSLGFLDELSYPFFPNMWQSGNLYLSLKVRGAGGKSITRRAAFTLDYFDPNTDTSPVVSGLDTSDNTPPAPPVVTLSGEFTPRDDLIYAEWGTSDPESGIQGYEYAVGLFPGYKDTSQSGYGQTSAYGTTTTIEAYSQSESLLLAEPEPDVPTEVLSWTDAGGRTEANIRDLQLASGQQYVVSVRATNGVGLRSIGTSGPILVDTTQPTAPAVTSFSQVSADEYPNSVEFSFQEGTDPESGIARHSFALGTSESSTDLFPWTEAKAGSGIIADLPVMDGTTVYLLVRAENMAGLQEKSVSSLVMSYSDTTAPAETQVRTEPPFFSSDDSSITILWGEVTDKESGVVGYQYGIGTSPGSPNVLPWTQVSREAEPYLIGQGETGELKPGEKPSEKPLEKTIGFGWEARETPGRKSKSAYLIEESGLSLSHGGIYYALVKTINGSGLNSISASEPLVIDQTPPTGTSLSAAPEQISRTTLKVRVAAEDSESGIASYRYAVWELGSVSMRNGGETPTRLRSPVPGSSNPGGYYAIPVAGFLAEGAFQGTTQSQGHQFQQYQQSDSGLTPEGQQYQLSPGLELDIAPWFESDWESFSGGANPESIDLEIGITGFPGSGLSFGKRYQVKLWVMNGAGLTRYTGAVIIKVVNVYSGPTMEAEQQGTQQGTQQAVPGGGMMLIP